MTETAEASPAIPQDERRRTIARLWRDAVDADRSGPAYLVEGDDGSWSEISWAEADERIRAYANGFLARGVRKGDNVAILARNSLDWALVDFALAQIGAVGIPIYANSSPKDVAYLLAHSEAVGIVCEDAEQLAKVESASDELPKLEHVLTYHDLAGLASHGIDFAQTHPHALDEATAAIDEEDLYTILYTSGTTGPPKGCMVDHGYWLRFVDLYLSIYGLRPEDRLLTCLNFFYNDPPWQLLTALQAGTSFVAMRRFSVSRFLGRLRYPAR